jgi:hypothetical protein
MKFEGLGLIVKLFGFWRVCLWYRSTLGVSLLFLQTTNFSYKKKLLRITPILFLKFSTLKEFWVLGFMFMV